MTTDLFRRYSSAAREAYAKGLRCDVGAFDREELTIVDRPENVPWFTALAATFGTGTVPHEAIEDAVREVFDLKPRGIITQLKLKQPIYRHTAAYGHFGRTPQRMRYTDENGTREVETFTWEDTNRVEDLRLAVQRSKHYASSTSRT